MPYESSAKARASKKTRHNNSYNPTGEHPAFAPSPRETRPLARGRASVAATRLTEIEYLKTVIELQSQHIYSIELYWVALSPAPFALRPSEALVVTA